MWYAVDAGPARFYMLTAAWADGNIGTGSVYQNDRDAHWLPNSAEYQWLKDDLAAHPNALKFAFWHYPLYADSSSQPSDTFLQGGTGTLQGLLNQNNVAIAFNGHAHGYERNRPDAGRHGDLRLRQRRRRPRHGERMQRVRPLRHRRPGDPTAERRRQD